MLCRWKQKDHHELEAAAGPTVAVSCFVWELQTEQRGGRSAVVSHLIELLNVCYGRVQGRAAGDISFMASSGLPGLWLFLDLWASCWQSIEVADPLWFPAC